jgi:hypothetical protein
MTSSVCRPDISESRSTDRWIEDEPSRRNATVTDTRIEEDLLGAKEVPIGAYYGIHTVRAMENFRISSATVGDVPEMVRGMVMVKRASAMANKDM